MKKVAIIILILFITCLPQFAQMQTISQEEAVKIVLDEIIKKDTTINYYIFNELIKENSEIPLFFGSLKSPDYLAWVIFINDLPFESWNHPCRYVFINAYTGKLEIIKHVVPPKSSLIKPLFEKKLDFPGEVKPKSGLRLKNIATTNNDWAVIISGGMDPTNNWVRYWNNCAALYTDLIEVYNFNEDHIFVLMSDGTNPNNDRRLMNGRYDSSPLDLDEDGDADINYSATQANIETVFDILEDSISSSDNLFIYTTDHGGQESGNDAYINLWYQTMRDDEFADEVDRIDAGQIMVTMNQCYSGGFIDDLQSSNRVIATACAYDESAYAMPPSYLYSEFTYHWISAIGSATPYGNPVDADSDNDSFVSMKEAFNYAESNDTRDETPQYYSNPTLLGYHLALHGLIPYMSGPEYVCYSGTTFTANNVPDGATIDWEKSSNLYVLDGGDDEDFLIVRPYSSSYPSEGWIELTLDWGEDELELPQKTVMANPPHYNDISYTVYGPYPYEVDPYELSQNTNYEVHVNYNNAYGCFLSNYQWDLPEGYSVNWIYNNMIGIYTGYSEGGYFTVDASTCCGFKEVLTGYLISWGRGGEFMSFGPNPASSETTLELLTEDLEGFDDNTLWDLEIFDSKQILKASIKHLKGSTYKINVSDWDEGIYIVRVIIGDKLYSSKLIVYH